MSLPKEPRQKMINMMYLVLTALLALNVSAEILNAFKTVDRSLMIASKQADKQNEQIFYSFDEYLKDPTTKDKAEYYKPLAERAKKLSEDLYNYIEELKEELKKESGLKTVDGKTEYKEDDLDAATRLLVEEAPEGKGKGKELFEKLKSYREQLLQINDTLKSQIESGLPIDLTIPPTSSEAGKNNWAYSYFHMTPTIAAVTILSKFQNDVRNSESKAVDFFLKQVGQITIRPNVFKAIAVGSSEKLLPGEEMIITAGIGSFSSEAKPIISIDGANVAINEEGVGEYKLVASSPGAYVKNVVITYKNPNDGKSYSISKQVKYSVGITPGLTVSTDKTRVFYKGLENPLSVTGVGGAQNLSVTVAGPTGISIKSVGAGQYIVTSPSLGEAIVTASDGKNIQKIKIPVKRVPDPIVVVGGSAGGGMAANVFRVQSGVIAELRDFVFEGQTYKVVSYSLICTGKGFETEPEILQVNGASFRDIQAQALIKRCQAGTTVTIGDIKVLEPGPGGTTRKLDQNITFILQ
jgi:gliding motility-associated protein GldM